MLAKWQDLGTVLAKLVVGDGKIQKSSSNTAITKSNDCYSLSARLMVFYSDKGCIQISCHTYDRWQRNTDMVELRASHTM